MKKEGVAHDWAADGSRETCDCTAVQSRISSDPPAAQSRVSHDPITVHSHGTASPYYYFFKKI